MRANSDSEEDQKLKLKVRDEVMAYLDERLPKSGSVKDAKAVLNDNIEEIGQIALATIHKEGYNYSVSVYFEKVISLLRHTEIWFFRRENMKRSE